MLIMSPEILPTTLHRMMIKFDIAGFRYSTARSFGEFVGLWGIHRPLQHHLKRRVTCSRGVEAIE